MQPLLLPPSLGQVGLLLVSKQWGFEETETKTIAFPIPFESIKYVFLSKIYGPASGGADTVAYNFFRKSLTGVSFDYAYTRNWLAIGGQQPQWGKPTVRGNNIFPIPFPNSALAITSAGIGGWHTVDVSIVNNNSYSVLGWATDSPSTARTSLPNVIAIGF